MGFIEWMGGFSLPDNESDCTALRTDESDAKPVQWNSIDEKCEFFKYSDEARLGMSQCTAEQMFDMSNNTCGENVADNSCPVGSYRDTDDGDCVAAPVNELSFIDSGEAYGPGKVKEIMKRIIGDEESHTRVDENGNEEDLCPKNNSFFIGGQCKVCPAEAPYSEEKDMCVCTDETMSIDPDTNTCVALENAEEAFMNKGKLSDQDMMILVILVVFIYMHRKKIMKALSKLKK